MISGKAKVRWLDINDQTSTSGSIDSLFREYSSKLELKGSSEFIIRFNKRDNVKIQDLFGWTNILAIKKKFVSGGWYWITCCDDPELNILMDESSVVPTYHKPIERVRGFHGEYKYPYIPRSVASIEDNDLLRVIVDSEGELETMNFREISCMKNKYECSDFGYEIYTKSKFCNVGGFSLFASENMKLYDKSGYK